MLLWPPAWRRLVEGMCWHTMRLVVIDSDPLSMMSDTSTSWNASCHMAEWWGAHSHCWWPHLQAKNMPPHLNMWAYSAANQTLPCGDIIASISDSCHRSKAKLLPVKKLNPLWTPHVEDIKFSQCFGSGWVEVGQVRLKRRLVVTVLKFLLIMSECSLQLIGKMFFASFSCTS